VIRTEIAVCGGRVVLVCTSDDGDVLEIVMSADEARQFSNGLGEAILRVSKAGVFVR
jgi:hypothetical protein